MVVRWPGHIKPGEVRTQLFAALDWLPTLVDIAGGPTGDALKKQIEAGKYPGIVKTTLDGVDQRAYLEGKTETSARDYFFGYSGATLSAVRYKNWKFYYTMAGAGSQGWLDPLVNYHWTQIQNIKRDPFEQYVGPDQKSAMSLGGAFPRRAPRTFTTGMSCPSDSCFGSSTSPPATSFPPLQAPESYNLSEILKQTKASAASGD